MEENVSYLAWVTGVLRRAGARLHSVRDAAAALAGGFLQPNLPQRQALGLREVKGPDVQAFQPGQDCHQLFSGYQPTAAGVSEVALHINRYKMSATLQLLKKSSFKEDQRTEKGRKHPWNRLV